MVTFLAITASLLFDRHRIILLCDRGTSMWTTCL